MMRAAKKDDNHAEIDEAFKALGYRTLDLSQLKNCCDLLAEGGIVKPHIRIFEGLWHCRSVDKIYSGISTTALGSYKNWLHSNKTNYD